MTTTEQYKERRAALVAALRSGEFEQGQDRLTEITDPEHPKHCCLGVACVVARRGGLEVQTTSTDGPIPGVRYSTGGMWHDGVMPPGVASWYGFMHTSGAYPGGSLISMNDRGKTFAEIADVIEREPQGLFRD